MNSDATELVSRLTIGLFWQSINSDNLGVGALTVSNIRLVEQAARRVGYTISFKIFGFLDHRPPYVEGPNIEFLPLNSKAMYLPGSDLGPAIRACDLILDIGAGDSYASIYPFRRLMMLHTSKVRTLSAGVPLIMSPQTIGPFETFFSRLVASRLLRRSEYVYVRDEKSLAHCLEDLHLPAEKCRLTTDVAFALPYTEPPARMEGSARPRVGINPSGLLFNGGYGGNNDYGLTLPFADLTRRLIEHFLQIGAEVHLVGHVNSERLAVDDDYRVCQALKAEYQSVHLAPNFFGPSQAKSYIADLDFFTGARMHACIAAASSGVPVVPLAYSRKFAGLFGSLGYDWTIDCRSADIDTAFDAVVRGFDNQEALKADLVKMAANAAERLEVYTNGIEATMRQIVASRPGKAG